MLKISNICCLIFILSACRTTRQPVNTQTPVVVANSSDSIKKSDVTPLSIARTDAFMENLLGSQPEKFGEILAHRQDLKVQVIYTQIDRKANNTPVFTPHYFNVDSQSYFYPASTVKMPIALLALEKLNGLGVAGLTKNSPMLTGAEYSGQTIVLNDPTAPDGIPTMAQYIKKIFLVSDNDAFNRLYEFLGQETINRQLAAKGYETANIYHRLSLPLSEDENRHTNPVWFTDTSGNQRYAQPPAASKIPYAKRKDSIGTSYFKDDKFVNGPMDFSAKNRIGLEDLTKVLRAILFPKSLPEAERFNLSADDYQFVRKYMSEYPDESNSPEYPAPDYWPTYCKFLFFGSDKNAVPKKNSMRIFNKVGDAYGFLTDIAYIVDFESGIEFMLSATIFCDSDGVLNDDKYDYDTIGYPFMKNLGKLFYDYESKRERKHKPDLTEFRIDYDKR